MKLGFEIALRFLKSNKGQTAMIILGIAIGVSVQIFIGSLIQGLQKGLVDKTIGSSPHITISSETDDKKINDPVSLYDTIKSADERVVYVSSALDGPAFLISGDTTKSLLIRGFDLDSADDIYNISSRVTEGGYSLQDNEIILGISLKDEYELSLGDEVTIAQAGGKTSELVIAGFFDLQVASVNSGWGITSIETARDVFGMQEKASTIDIQVDQESVFLADEIAANIEDALDAEEISADNWKEQNEQLLSGLQGQSISSLMIQIFVIVSVVLAIASVLAITVMQKSRQIGILKAMGIKNKDAGYVFLSEGLVLGIFGALAGIALGLGLSYAFTKFALNPDETPVVDLFIDPTFIAVSGIIAISASIIAALIPAVRSSKLDPIDIIRNN